MFGRRFSWVSILVAILSVAYPSPAGAAARSPWLAPSANTAKPPAAPSAGTLALPDDRFWWDGFALPDLDGRASCAILYNGSIVVGGRFIQIGGIAAGDIARWDGSAWSAFGDGFDADVTDLAVYRGELVAAGYFTRSGSGVLNGIARWDGTRWAPLGAGLTREAMATPAMALAVQGDFLYAAGDFDRAGGVDARHVARWDGEKWSPLGSGLDGAVQSLLAAGDSLYVGGSFQMAGDRPAPGIARWDGHGWSPVGAGISDQGWSTAGSAEVNALIRYRGTVVAAGNFHCAGDLKVMNIAAWDGSDWRALGTETQTLDPVDALAAIGDSLVVGSSDGLNVWDGSRWVRSLAVGSIQSVLASPAGLIVGGWFNVRTPDGKIVAVNLAVLRGNAWKTMGSWTNRTCGFGSGYGPGGITGLASYRGKVAACGGLAYAGSPRGRVPIRGVALWDGTRWSAAGDPPIRSAECMLANRNVLYLGGEFGPHNPYQSSFAVYAFDGAKWTPLDTLSLRATGLALYRESLFVSGYRRSFGEGQFGPKTGGVYRWDGAHWTAVGLAGQGDSGVHCLVEYSGRLIAAGPFDEIGGIPAKRVAAWDGKAWAAMDGGIESGYPTALGVCDDHLYAGGNQLRADGRDASVVQWDGVRWRPILEELSGPAAFDAITFACASHRLFVGGGVADENSTPLGIMRWDGTSWSTLGSGLNDSVFSLLVHEDGRLYAGGGFVRAGDKSSWGIARWDLPAEQREAASVSSSAGAPNPFRFEATIAYQLRGPVWVRVIVVDAHGRPIVTLDESQRPAGTHVVVWDGRDRDGHEMPPGIYFVQLDLGGHTETRRIARLK